MFPERSQVTFPPLPNFASVTLNPRKMEQQITLETLYQRTVTLEETLSLILNLLTKEERKKKEAKDEKDEIISIPGQAEISVHLLNPGEWSVKN